MSRPSAMQIALAIVDSLPYFIRYSGSDDWRVTATKDLTPTDGDGGAPFATEVTIQDGDVQHKFILILASPEDVKPLGSKPYHSWVGFEVEQP